MGVVRTKSGLTSTTRTTRDQLIIFIDIITKIHFLEGRRMPFRPVSSNQSRHVLRAHRRFTALVYATFRSPTTPHRSRVTRHLPADMGHGNGWILLSDSDQSEESNGWILLSDSDQSEESNGWILLSDSDQSEESNGWILLSDSDQSEPSSHARYRWYKRHCAFISPHFLL